MKIITIPNKILRNKNLPIIQINKQITNLILNLKKTLNDAKNPDGVGLACPQIGKNWQIFLTKFKRNEIKIYLNPTIINHSKQKNIMKDITNLEGCLSIPHVYGHVPRWEMIELQYQEINNNQLITKTDKFIKYKARVIQHEYDHLQGILFTDHVLYYQTNFFLLDNNQLKECHDYQLLKTILI